MLKYPLMGILIVADGLEKLHASMREYLQAKFALPPELFDDASSAWGSSFQTFISSPLVLGGVTLHLNYLNDLN